MLETNITLYVNCNLIFKKRNLKKENGNQNYTIKRRYGDMTTKFNVILGISRKNDIRKN